MRLAAIAELAHTLLVVGRLHEAASLLTRAVELARGVGAASRLEVLLAVQANVRGHRGRLVEAAALIEQAIEAGRTTANPQAAVWTFGIRAWIEAERGDPSGALAAADVAVERLSQTRRTLFAWLPGAMRGRALLDLGRVAEGRTAILAAGGGPWLRRIPPPLRPGWFCLLAHAEVAAGRTSLAETWIARAASCVGLGTPPGARGALLLARARLALSRGELSAAARSAQIAARLELEAEAPVAAARAWLLAGFALARAERTSTAIHELRTAHTVATDHAAMAIARRAERELKRVGVRPDPPPSPDERALADAIGRLTAEERRVAELVGAGLRNSDIGHRLHLSARTIERHVTLVRRKLGASSRAGLVALVARAPERFAAHPSGG
jgi:DNA-binding NarL/FixJ family response regulator